MTFSPNPINESPALYLVATPMGNLRDISFRALDVLFGVDRILAEDTRHCAKLLNHYQISTPALSYHEHNELDRLAQIKSWLGSGERLALVSDAGTPLISDPGFPLVRALIAESISVIAIPGPCAAIAALSVSGLGTDSFLYVGFLPAKAVPRQDKLKQVLHATQTLIIYESKHRLLAMLADCNAILGGERLVAVCRELTKAYESIYRGTLSELLVQLSESNQMLKGEFVIVIEGAAKQKKSDEAPLSFGVETAELITELRKDLPDKRIAQLLAKLAGGSKRDWYQFLLGQES